MKRKILAIIFALFCAVGLTFSLSACNVTPEPEPEPEPTPAPDNQEHDDTETKKMTFEDFIKDHKSVAAKFFEDYIYDEVAGEKTVKSESRYLNDKDGDGKTESACMCYIYEVDETKRALEVANVTFSPIAVQDVVDGKVTSVQTTVAREAVFTFDAKECYQNQDFAAALYNAADWESDTMIFAQTNENMTQKQYGIVNMSDSEIEIDYIAAKKGDGTKEAFIRNLSNNPTIYSTTTKLEGTLLYSSAYALEKIEDEPPKAPDEEEQPSPPVTVTNAEIISALETNCIDDIVNTTKLGGLKQDKNNIVDGTWYLTKNSDGNITKAEYAYTYKISNDSAYYVITEVNFATPLTSNDIKNSEVNGTANNSYTSKNYRLSIQDQDSYKDLTKAICDKAFKTDPQYVVARYIIKGSSVVGAIFPKKDEWGLNKCGISQSFTVIEITTKGVQEATMSVCYDQDKNMTTELYIENIENGYCICHGVEKYYNISGIKLQKTDLPFENNLNVSENTATDEQMINALERNCLNGIYKTLFNSQYVNASKIDNANWYVVKDENGNVLSAEYSFYYKQNSSNTLFYVARVIFETPYTYEDMQKSLSGVYKEAVYTCGYHTELYDLQKSHMDVVNAICGAGTGDRYLLGIVTLASFYLDYPEPGGDYVEVEATTFIGLEINETCIKWHSSDIKKSSSDAEYVSNYNSGNCRHGSSIEYSFLGKKLTA